MEVTLTEVPLLDRGFGNPHPVRDVSEGPASIEQLAYDVTRRRLQIASRQLALPSIHVPEPGALPS